MDYCKCTNIRGVLIFATLAVVIKSQKNCTREIDFQHCVTLIKTAENGTREYVHLTEFAKI